MRMTQRECINLQNRLWTAPNEWNACLDMEALMLQEIIRRGGLEYTCASDVQKRYRRPPWEVMPPEGERLRESGSIVLPADGTAATVLTFKMPKGWDGVATIISNVYRGPGFVDGSGDLIWSLQVGARFIPDYGQQLEQTSDEIFPAPLEGAYVRLLSLQVVTVSVAVGATASVRLTPPGRVNSALLGWKYPKR